MTTSSPTDFLPLRASHFHILLCLVDGPQHGYGIRRVVEERTAGRVLLAAGTLYETLQRLERDDLIAETGAPPEAAAEAGSRWRFFGLTTLGGQVLTAEVRRLEADLLVARQKLPALG